MVSDTGAQISRAMMSAPSRASRAACARPCPRAAPVMNATRPCNDPDTLGPFRRLPNRLAAKLKRVLIARRRSEFGDDLLPGRVVFGVRNAAAGAQFPELLQSLGDPAADRRRRHVRLTGATDDCQHLL